MPMIFHLLPWLLFILFTPKTHLGTLMLTIISLMSCFPIISVLYLNSHSPFSWHLLPTSGSSLPRLDTNSLDLCTPLLPITFFLIDPPSLQTSIHTAYWYLLPSISPYTLLIDSSFLHTHWEGIKQTKLFKTHSPHSLFIQPDHTRLHTVSSYNVGTVLLFNFNSLHAGFHF